MFDQVYEPLLRPCLFCNTITLGQFERDGKTYYRPFCNCGWAGRANNRRWLDNKSTAIETYNNLIHEVSLDE